MSAPIHTSKHLQSSRRYSVYSRLSQALTVTILFILLAGCASTGTPDGKELAEIRSIQKSVVLLRVDARIGNRPYQAFKNDLVDDNLCFGLGSFDTGGRLHRIEKQRFLSTESRLNGWTYLVLTPGTYYLTIQPARRTDIFTYQRRFDAPPRWRLEVPPKASILYAGTLRLNGVGDPLLFGGSIMREILKVSVDALDQTPASALSATHFPDLGTPWVVPLQSHEGGTLHFRMPLQSAP